MNSPLQQLQPLIYPAASPAPASWWPWLAAAALLSSTGLLLWRWHHQRRQQQRHLPDIELIRKQALQELEQIPMPRDGQPAGPWLQQLNQLLKRISSARYPEHNSHRLSGRLWLAFLDSRCPAAGLTHWMVLVEGSYQPSCQLSASAIAQLHTAVRLWIEKHA